MVVPSLAKIRAVSLPGLLLGLGLSGSALADDELPGMPEPIFNETVTDLDSRQAGELEIATNLETLHALRGGGHHGLVGLEAEWRLLRSLGVQLEGAYPFSFPGDSVHPLDLQAALGLGLWHDWERGLHLQAEFSARGGGADRLDAQPGEFALPYALTLRGGFERGSWTLRPSLAAEVGGAAAHVPIYGAVAALRSLGGEGEYGFLGIELEADGARLHPLALTAEQVLDFAALKLPMRLGLAIPYVVGPDRRSSSLGIYLRFQFRLD